MKFKILFLISFFLLFLSCQCITQSEIDFFNKLVQLNPQLTNFDLPSFDDSLCTFSSALIYVFCDDSMNIQTLQLKNLQIPDEIRNLTGLSNLQVNSWLGAFPNSLPAINYLNIGHSDSPVALPNDSCFLTSLNSYSRISYIPPCASSLNNVKFKGIQDYFFGHTSDFPQLSQIILSGVPIPPFHTWLGNLTILSNLFIDNTNLRFISSEDFDLIGKVTNVIISSCKLSNLPSSVNLTNTYKLELSNNLISTFPNFTYCPYLGTLNLANNLISSLPSDINCKSITDLTLSYNKLTSVPNWQLIPAYLNSHFDHNLISEFPQPFWNFLNQSTTIDLSFNMIRSFPSYFEFTAYNLNILDLSDNPLTILPNFLSSANVNINILYLRNCNLSAITNEFVSRIRPGTLDLSQNFLTQLPSNTFAITPQYYFFNASHNLLELIPTISVNLNTLDLSYNKISIADNNLLLTTTTYLDLSYNPFVNWTFTTQNSSSNIDNLILKNVNITSIPDFLQNNLLTVNYQLDISHNQLVSLDGLQISGQLNYLKAKNTSLEEFNESVFRNFPSLSYIDIADNPLLFNLLSNPNGSTNYNVFSNFAESLWNILNFLNVSNTGLTKTFSISSIYISNLDYSSNQLTNITNQFQSHSSLRKLYLGNNKLDSYPSLYNVTLDYIDVGYNQIRTIPIYTMGLTSNISLDGNPLDLCQTPMMWNGDSWPPTSYNNFQNLFDDSFISLSIYSPNKLSLKNLKSPTNKFYSCGCLHPELAGNIIADFTLPPICGFGCSGEPPVQGAKCEGRNWIVYGSELDPSSPVIITGPTTIIGDLNINSSDPNSPSGLIFSGIDSSLKIQGCFQNDQPLTLQVDKPDVNKLQQNNKVVLVTAQSGICIPTISNKAQQLIVQKKKDFCHKVSGTVQSTQESNGATTLSAVLKVNSNQCKVWWIILVSVICGVVLIAMITVLILFLTVKSFRKFISPYHGSNS